MLATGGDKMFSVFKIKECGESRIGLEDDTAAISPVASIGASSGDVFFPAKRDTPITTIARFYENFGFVNEFQRCDLGGRNNIDPTT